jgi:hypothetical protein
MKNCWSVLGIPPGSGEAIIKARFRELVKQWHPDKVQSPEKKRRYTIKCAEVNYAYREALTAHRNRPAEEVAAESPRVSRRYRVATVVGGVIGLAVAIAFLSLVIAGPLALVARLGDSHPVSIAIHIVVSVLGGLLFGMVFTFVPDAIAFFATQKLWEKLALGRYEEKLSWCVVLALNLFIMFAGPGALIGEGSRVTGAYFTLTRATAALLVPFGLFALWVGDIRRARKAHASAREAVAIYGT